MQLKKYIAAAAYMVALGGCASSPRAVSLDFLEHQPVTRSQVVAQLGPANSSFNADYVLTYWLRQNKADYFVMPRTTHNLGWEGVNYDLVLAFDDTGILHQHRLVLIRPVEHAR